MTSESEELMLFIFSHCRSLNDVNV